VKQAKEKWVPCTATFPDYEICLGPVIAIRRVKTAQGSYKGKTIAIQHYRNQFWATLYNRFGEAKRVNVLDMANWASTAEWKRLGGKTANPEPVRTEWKKPPQPVQPVEPPKPVTRERLLSQIAEVERSHYADSVKRREIRELQAKLAALNEVGGVLSNTVPA
jgi:hypothetical protein